MLSSATLVAAANPSFNRTRHRRSFAGWYFRFGPPVARRLTLR